MVQVLYFFEIEAQTFTYCVLCPIILLRCCQIKNACEIKCFSGIPIKEATVLSQYLSVYEKYNISPLEQQLKQQFAGFIADYQKNRYCKYYFRGKEEK